MKKILLGALLSSVLSAFACTTFASFNGESGSFVMAKNRDNRPDHQIVEVVAEKDKYKYVALSRADVPDFVSAGVNEHNLAVFNEVTVEHSQLAVGGIADDFSKDILQNYRSATDVIPDLAKLVAKYPDPVFYQVADGKNLLNIEVGANHHYSYKLITNGNFVHTNNYLESSLIKQYKYSSTEVLRKQASVTRLQRAGALLDTESALSLTLMQQIGLDHNAGNDDSIYRTGKEAKPQAVRSLAFFGVQIGNSLVVSKILVNLYNSGEYYSYTLDDNFWKHYTQQYTVISPQK